MTRSNCTKSFPLNNGESMPAVGLGTWQGSTGSDDEAQLKKTIIHALKSGYRLIDTAQLYDVEHIVGEAIRESGVPRSELYVVTKFWGQWHHDPATALQNSLDTLGMDYVDMFLMHWPWATTPDKKMLRKWESPTTVETWKMMEDLVGDKCRGIGVSNFGRKPLEELMAQTKIVPAINQVELHAFNPNLKLVPWCQSKGIHVMSWCTLGGSGDPDGNQILHNPLFKDISKEHECSCGVVSLSWCVQRGITVIPRSGSLARIEENFKLVTLTDGQMKAMDTAQDTVKQRRIANGIKSQQRETDGKMTLMGWSFEDFGWEDEKGNWLT